MSTLKIGKTSIAGLNDGIYIIAEIGQNHQGCIDIAKQMILQAKKIGCNCVKFQKSCLNEKFTKTALDRQYDGVNSWGSTYGEHKEYLEFSLQQYRELQEFSKEHEIDFTASAMDEISLMQLNDMDVPFIKIGSGDANNFILLKKAAQLQRPLVISTGMQTMTTIERIVQIMNAAGKNNYALLHCVSAYPTEPKDCTLQLISMLKRKFPNVVIGYSGHEQGVDITKAAVLLGAKIVERHFTLDKQQKGSDHKCSLDADQFQQLVRDLRAFEVNGKFATNEPMDINQIKNYFGYSKHVEQALATVEEKQVLPCELSCRNKLGKSVVTARALKKGHLLQEADICIKVSEPNGVSAEHYELLIDKTLKCDVPMDVAIQFNDFL